MPEKVPRRLMRFNRGNYSNTNIQSGSKDDYAEPTAPDGRPLLSEIPTMNYEDMEKNSKNYEEKKPIEAKSMEEKLALEEVQKFKKTFNRFPTNEESEGIAENIFNQLKNVDTSTMYSDMPAEEKGGENSPDKRSKRADRRSEREGNPTQKTIPTNNQTLAQTNSQNPNPSDIKSLLGEDSPKKGKKQTSEDEFDLGLDSDMGESSTSSGEDVEDESIEDLELSDKEICPNCKKETEKVVYCPKCGTAFCENCSQKEGNQLICPKCKARVKA
ncbi:MAG: hypothetical protein WCW13_02390 [archaeon]|jgi:hypothetical protein